MPESATPRVLPPPATGAPPVPRVPIPVRWVTDAGLRVVVVPHRVLPRVAVRLVLPAGSVSDPDPSAGTAALVGSLLPEGTERLSAREFSSRLDALGAAASVSTGHDFSEMSLSVLRETFEPGLALFAEMLLRPAFRAAETERVRAETLDGLAAREDEPANVADDRLAREVFGSHPYGRLPAGTVESVGRISRDALTAFHAEKYRPVGSILLVSGAIEADEVREVVERELAGWEGEATADAYPAFPEGRGRGEVARVDWEGGAQAEIRWGGRGMRRADEDWPVGAVANYLLGGSTITGRLGANLREEKGWTYGVRSGFSAGVQPGGWIVETAVDAEVADAAMAEIRGELERFSIEPVEEQELERAKDALVLSLPRAFETPGRIIGRFATVEAYGLEPDYWDRFSERVRRVTPEDVLRVARTHFAPGGLARVVVSPNGSE